MHSTVLKAHSGVSVEELLQETAYAGDERERSASARLGELAEHVADERLVAADRIDVAGAAGSLERGGVDRVDGVAHRRAVGVGARDVIIQIAKRQASRHRA